MKTKMFLIVVFFLCWNFIYSQLQVQGGLNANQLVNILVGSGVSFSNATYSGPSGCIGGFSNGQTTNLGLASGILLSTGGISNVPNPASYFLSNNMGGSGDPTLQQMAGNTSYDAVVLQFNFVPLSSPVTFRYVFGSEEYPEYVCSSFNDVFGFFVSGPNPQGGNYNNTNVALIPGTTTPVMINSVNPGVPGSYGSSSNCVSLNYSQYYVSNSGSTICFDGFTTVLSATIAVVPCQTYHIKIAISDIGDGIYDSGVFLEANSFTANAINPGLYFTNAIFNQFAIEGCSNAIVSFTLPQPSNQPVTVNYTISGTATNGVDYATVPSQVVIPAGQDSAGLIFNFAMDGVAEGPETIILYIQTSPCGWDTLTITVYDNSPLTVSTTPNNITICNGQQPISFSANASGGYGTYTYNWSNNLGNSANVTTSPPVGNYNYIVTVADQCGQTATANVQVTVNPLPTATFTVQSPICAGQPSTVAYTGTGASSFQWNLSGATILSGNPSSGQPFQITWTQAGTYPVILQTTSSVGCVSQPETLYVVVYGAGTPNCCQFPTPYAGPDATVCGLTYQLQADPPDNPAYVGLWTQISGPGVSSFSNQGYFASAVTVSQQGTYVFEWKEINGPCDSTDYVTITFIQMPVPNAGPDASICGLSYTMQASLSIPTATGQWSGTGIVNPSSPTTQVNVPTYGSYTYVWTETNSGCSAKDTVIITFLTVPQPNAGNDTIACGVKGVLSATSVFPGYWTGPNNVIYVNGHDTTYTPIIIPNYPGSSYQAQFVWHAHNNACWGTDTVVITFIRPPHAEAGQQISVCGTFAQLNADTIGSGIISAYWYSSPTGPIINQQGNIPFNATVDISNMGPSAYHYSVGEYWLYWVVFNGICHNYDSVKVNFYEIPTAYAGKDTSICGKSYNLNATWSIANRTGLWYQISGPGTANFASPTSNQTLVTVTQYGTYKFVWKEMNAAAPQCFSTDTITIEFKVIPMPDAGLDFGVCSMYAYICATPGGGSNGKWSGPSGVAFCLTPDDNNCSPQYADSPCVWIRWPSENDTITMYWTEFNGVCYGYDSVNVYFGRVYEAVIL
ncbi:MAG: choice-of-anchor L domain-containing protein, partial [Bacteroidales bacterium]|nr:choice-of-anchor L domain-containing protein [Bacteroidales bacterium]